MKMACCRALVAVFYLLLCGGLCAVSGDDSSLRPCEFPAIYNFGDSNSDTGSYSAVIMPIPPPNADGKECDGRLIIDFIAEHLKLPHLSAYMNSLGANFRHGASFAVAGSSIRRQNVTLFENGVSAFSLDVQLVQFNGFKQHSKLLYHKAKAALDRDKLPRQEEFAKALYIFDIGQIDVFLGIGTMSLDQFRASIADIIDPLASAVQNIYEGGGRAFWIHNTGPIGCLPIFVLSNRNQSPEYFDEHGCLKARNDMAVVFNMQLKERVIKLRAELPDAAITYVDIYAAKYELITNAKKLGYADPFKFCCGSYKNNVYVMCGTKAIINNTEVFGASCKDPSKFISWDGGHYSEAANQWVTNRIIYGGSYADPSIPITQACHRQV